MYPIVRLAGNIAVSNVTELSAPYKLIYALTYQCQLKCSMCHIWKRKPLPELTSEEIREFFRRSNAFSWINLSGGEIFLRPDLPEIFNAIATSCKGLYLLNFPTNGFLTEVIVDAVTRIVQDRQFPKVLVTVSLDGPPELHDRIRSMPGSWDRAVDTYQRLRRLRSRGFNVYFGMTLQDANAHAFEEMVRSVGERIGDIHYGDFHVNLQHTSEHYYDNAGSSRLMDKQRVLDRLGAIETLRNRAGSGPVKYLEQRYQALASVYLLENRTPVACQALAASLFMDPAGTLYPCTIYNRPIGNIKDHGYCLGDLWNTGQRQSVRTEIRAGNCPQCWTPCEAYQSILANVVPIRKRSRL